MDPALARSTWRSGEPVHAQGYFTPELQEEYAGIGLDTKNNRAVGYFPGRAAPMGKVDWPVVQATFFNFAPLAVQFGMTGVWDLATPEQVWDARVRGNRRALTRLLGPLADDVEEAADLVVEASGAVTPYGRPMAATHVAMPVPEDDLMRLWWGLTVLREYRGDGHIAVLVEQELTGAQANVLDVARGQLWSRKGLQGTRAWSDAEWDEAVEALTARGWITPEEGFTDAGREAREQIEVRTDVAGMAPWARLGEDRCARLTELLTPLSEAVVANGGFPTAAS